MKKILFTAYLFLFSIFGWSQNSITIILCECQGSDMLEIIRIAQFYGYRFDNYLVSETGVSDYTSSLSPQTAPSSTTNLVPKLIILNYNGGGDKRIVLAHSLEKFESRFELTNREYYSKDQFLGLIQYN